MTLEEIRERYFNVHAVSQFFTESTIKSKKYGINNFLNFVGNREIDAELVKEYMAKMINAGASRNYVNTRIYSIVKPFLEYADRRGAKININWDDDFPRRKKVKIYRTAYARDEVERLVDACQDLTDYLIIVLCYALGLRRIELTRITRETVDGDKLFMNGKGDKREIIRMPTYVKEAIECKFSMNRNRYLLCSTNRKNRNAGKPISLETIRYRSKRIAKRAGVKNLEEFSPHKLRYSFATELYDSGADMRTIQHKLRHESIKTTEIYVQSHNQAIEDEYDRCFEDFDREMFEKHGRFYAKAY